MGKRKVKAISCISSGLFCAACGIFLCNYRHICLFLFIGCALALCYLPFSIKKVRNHPVGRILFRVVDVIACGILAISVFLGLDVLQLSPDHFSGASFQTILPLIDDFLKAVLLRFVVALPF